MAQQRSIRHIDRFLVVNNSVLLLPLVGSDCDIFGRYRARRINKIILGAIGLLLSLVYLPQNGAEGGGLQARQRPR